MASYFQQLDNEFGPGTRTLLKDYATQNRKLGNTISRKEFLLRCRRSGVFPTHITNVFRCVFPLIEDNSPYLNELNRHVDRFKKAILNVEIKHTFHKLKQQKENLSNLKLRIRQNMPEDESRRFLEGQDSFFERHVRSTAIRTGRKYQTIINRSLEATASKTPSLNTKSLLNSTDVTIPSEVELLLSLGSKFALPFTDMNELPIYHLIADVENVVRTNRTEEIQERNRCGTANQIQNFLHAERGKRRHDPVTNFYRTATKSTKQFLKQHPEIVVIEADKGNKTVVMQREEYDNKLQRMIDDDDTYRKLNRDPTSRYQTQNNQFAKRLADLKLIDRSTEMKLKTYKAIAPRIYGAPKAHKEGLPLRPVVPCMTSPSYTLSQYVGKIIQKSIPGRYNVKNSFTFSEYINNVQLPPDYVLISLDVVSLFTCIPKDLVLHDVIYNWENIQPHTNINLDLFLEMTAFCIDCSYFRFKGQHYQQVFGTAMGNPLSPTIADLVMETLLNTVVERIGFQLPVLKKYVDDLILAVPREKIEQVRETFNQYHPKIQFTVEIEKQGRIPFLDMLLVRQNDQTVKTEWYMKPIASGRFINYHSAHNIKLKVNVAKNFIHRVKSFSTNVDKKTAEQTIFSQLKSNDYPAKLINRLINRSRERHIANQTNDVTAHEDTQYRSMVQVGQLTGQIQKSLKRDYPNVVISTKNVKTVGSLLPTVKDKIDTNNKCNVIYKIPCTNCSSCYVGMTSNQLKTRIASHRSCSNRLQTMWEQGKTADDHEIATLREMTALLNHSVTTQHIFAFDRTQILDTTLKKQNLPILETCHIINTPHTINKRTDTDNLSSTYAGILHTIKNNRCSRRTARSSQASQTVSTQSE